MGGHHHEPTREQIFAPIPRSWRETYLQQPLFRMIDVPVTFIKTQIVDKLRMGKQVCYHEKYERVPGVEDCVMGDRVCMFKAEEQFNRDYRVEYFILDILRRKYERCRAWYEYDKDDVKTHCSKFFDQWETSEVNFFIKYGRAPINGGPLYCLMRQKHRMLFERIYGEVGTGKTHEVKVLPKIEAPQYDAFDYLRNTVGISKLPKEMQP